MSMSFNGVLKYIVYIFMGAWLFLLGVMAGRGTAPVTFETRGFQERLKTIVAADTHPDTPAGPNEKIALHYYDALSDEKGFEEMVIPAPSETSSDTAGDPRQTDTVPSEKAAEAEKDTEPAEEIPVKTSKKLATFKPAVAGKQREAVSHTDEPTPSARQPDESNSQGRYTIQVAAFKSFRDAVTQMATLEKKGFTANRTAKELDGITWYRVRVGEFTSRDAAAQYLKQLNQAGISGMIITRD